MSSKNFFVRGGAIGKLVKTSKRHDPQQVFKPHILSRHRKGKLKHLEDYEILQRTSYPAEYPTTHIPVPNAEVPEQPRGRQAFAWFYKIFKEQCKYLYRNTLILEDNCHRNLMYFDRNDPERKMANTAWVAPSASVIGDVTLAEHSNVWYGCVLRGDKNSIRIGAFTNIQDGTIITTDDNPYDETNVVIGEYTTVGHGCRLHGCKIGQRCLIGMGSVILEGAVIEDGAIIAAGSVVPPGRRVPANQLWAGNPVSFRRHVGKIEVSYMEDSSMDYVDLAMDHSKEFTTYNNAYKELEKLIEKEEELMGPKIERPEPHWNVWSQMGVEGRDRTTWIKGDRQFTDYEPQKELEEFPRKIG